VGVEQETGAASATQAGAADPGFDKVAIDRAFTQLYQDNLRDVYSFLYYRLGNHHDAEDVSEQVFLQAYRHLPKALAESEGRSLRPWLIRIAQNLAINLYRDRSRKPQAPLDAAGEFADQHDTEHLVESREELTEVFEKVAELGDDRREALIMRFALGMDNHEIARAMGKTEGATKVLLHRAIKQLEEQLGERP
jgi:RNA polymerase sigma-70 factor (ECF subfamily)